MELHSHERFIAGNQELREILRRAEGVGSADGRVTEEDLTAIGVRLQNLTPEVGDASRSETLDVRSLGEVAEYVKNLRTLQQAIEKIRSAPADRRARSEPARRNGSSIQHSL